METDEYVSLFNQTNSFRSGDYPKKLWSNSYFVSLVDAIFNGTKPTSTRKQTSGPKTRPALPSRGFDEQVRRLRQASNLAPPAGQPLPQRKTVSCVKILRDPAVKAWVLRNSGKRCAACWEPAPFKDDDNLPFLEVHHVVPLAKGGPDTIDNAVALCPNCHRAFHHAKERKKHVAKLYKTHARLKALNS